jgi:hypothetical protein
MKIRRITAYQVDLPLHEGSYKWSGGKSVQPQGQDENAAVEFRIPLPVVPPEGGPYATVTTVW